MSWGVNTVRVPNASRKKDMMRLLGSIRYRTVEMENGVLFGPLITSLGDLGGVAVDQTIPTQITLAHDDDGVLDELVKRVEEVLGGLSVREFSVSSILSQIFQDQLLNRIYVNKQVS
eukprot:sb/3476549/